MDNALDILSELDELADGINSGKVANIALGSRRSTILGDGRERYDVSEWEPGDPFNSIDWALTLIHWPDNILKVNRRETKVLPLVVALDAADSMLVRFAENECKFRLMLRLAATLCLASIRERDPICVTSFGNPSAFFLPPRHGRGNLFHAVEVLAEDAANFYQELSRSKGPRNYSAASDINECLADILARVRQQSVVVVISDFVDVIYGRRDLDENVLSNLVSRHKENVVFIILDDKEEFGWSGGHGTIMTRDIGTGQLREIKAGRAGRIRSEHAQRQRDFQRYLEDQGIDSIVVYSEGWFDKLSDFAAGRQAA